jgi:hypothetical protein
MAKELPVHKDIFGQELVVDDCVVYPQSNSMQIGKVTKINPKMISVKSLAKKGWSSSTLKYPNDLVKVQGPEVTMYLLTRTHEGD